MKVILAPAKKMTLADDDFSPESRPLLREKSRLLLETLKAMSPAERKSMWKCGEKIALESEAMLERMDLENGLSPAVFSYIGLAYQNLSPGSMTYDELDWLRGHLRILSGFYGILRPFDGILPYRLEMQARLPVNVSSSLYDFWGDDIFRTLNDTCIVNLASREYAMAVEPYLNENCRYITVIFAEETNGRLIQKGTYAKALRGKMVRYMAENSIEEPEEIRGFNIGAVYHPELSSEKEYIFIRK